MCRVSQRELELGGTGKADGRDGVFKKDAHIRKSRDNCRLMRSELRLNSNIPNISCKDLNLEFTRYLCSYGEQHPLLFKLIYCCNTHLRWNIPPKINYAVIWSSCLNTGWVWISTHFPKEGPFAETHPLLWEWWVVVGSASHTAAFGLSELQPEAIYGCLSCQPGSCCGRSQGSLVSSSVTFFTAPWKP